MSGWVVLVLIAAAVAVMVVFRRPDKQRVDWASMRRALARPDWANKAVRTDHTQKITVELGELGPEQNAELNRLVAKRDVAATVDFLLRETGRSRKDAIDFAERVTGREHKE